MENYGLDTQIMGKDIPTFIADLLEKNESQQIEIERGKLANNMLKQLNNHAKLRLGATQLQLRQQEFAYRCQVEKK